MMNISNNIAAIRQTLPDHVTLVCVSKFHPVEAIREAYDCGERDFGESRVQELVAKHEALPKDIRWHFIGHLQTNKVKQIVPFVHLIQSVDSWHLLEVINTEAAKIGRVIDVLLEVHVAKEETKTGFSIDELRSTLYTLNSKLNMDNVHICGIMAMATNTDDESEIRRCFREVRALRETLPPYSSTPLLPYSSTPLLPYSSTPLPPILSIGMSDDYLIAIEEGSTMVRIGSSLFGKRS